MYTLGSRVITQVMFHVISHVTVVLSHTCIGHELLEVMSHVLSHKYGYKYVTSKVTSKVTRKFTSKVASRVSCNVACNFTRMLQVLLHVKFYTLSEWKTYLESLFLKHGCYFLN